MGNESRKMIASVGSLGYSAAPISEVQANTYTSWIPGDT